MQKRNLGKISLEVSAIGFGCLGLNFSYLHRLEEIGLAAGLQGLGTALILAIIEQVRDRDEQTRAAASAEARALQARMNPHFLSKALNTLAALSRIAPREVPRVVGRLRLSLGGPLMIESLANILAVHLIRHLFGFRPATARAWSAVPPKAGHNYRLHYGEPRQQTDIGANGRAGPSQP